MMWDVPPGPRSNERSARRAKFYDCLPLGSLRIESADDVVYGVHVILEILVAFDKRDATADIFVDAARSFPQLFLCPHFLSPEINRLCRAEQFERQYLLEIFRDLPQLESGG